MGYVTRLHPDEYEGLKGRGQIDIELTERCNNNCVHCCINLPEYDARAAEREMDAGFVKEILRQAAEIGFLTVRFTGGEPTLRPDFAELYLFARRLGMQVILFTNARRITPELAGLLARYPPGRVVEVSVYGMSVETYDRITRCSGAFDEFRRGVDLLVSHKIPFIVKGPKLPFIKDEKAMFEAWATTIPAMDQLPVYSMNFEFRARRDSPEKNDCIARFRATPEESVAMLAKQPNYLEEMAQYCSKYIGPPGDALFNCGAGHSVCIDAYGHAQACLPLRHPDYCVDLRGTTLKMALEERIPAMLNARASSPEYLHRCAKCFLKGLCEQCPAKSWTEYGTLDTPVEYLCEVAHAQARHLGLIGNDEYGWEVTDWKVRVARFAEAHRKQDI
ncbi:MAG: radical SAM protein [Chlorobiaceae bacterium]|nr:radical SAM protein [Chlorobiaceae bacterium]